LDVCDWLTGKELFGVMAYIKRQENYVIGIQTLQHGRRVMFGALHA